MNKRDDDINIMKKEINDTREMLYNVISQSEGNMLSPEVIMLSQKLDKLIVSFYIRYRIRNLDAANPWEQKAVSL